MHDLLYQYFKDRCDITRVTFESFKSLFKPRFISKNESLLSAGSICNFNLFVVEGCIRFFTINRKGDELTRYIAFPGKFGSSLSSFIEQKPSIEYIVALEDSQVLEISREDFYLLVETVKEVNMVYRDILEMAYITSQERIYGLQGESALQRLKWLMTYRPKILSELPNHIIASYLGITPFTLSRLKSKL